LAAHLECVGVLAGFSPPASAQDKWLETRSPNFTVVTNANDRTARNLVWQFEQIRSAIQAGWPWARVQLDRPIVVVAAKDESTMRSLLPRYWETRGGTRPSSVFTTASDSIRGRRSPAWRWLACSGNSTGAARQSVTRAGLTLARSDQQRAQAQEIIAFFERSAN
jgi:hypothetical protein